MERVCAKRITREKKHPLLEAVSARRYDGAGATSKTLIDDGSVPKRLKEKKLEVVTLVTLF
jgi:hypothetical protein